MRSYFRLLPLTITVAAILLLVKAVQGWQSGQDAFSSLFISSVVAQEEAPKEQEPEVELPESDPVEPISVDSSAEQPAPEEVVKPGGEKESEETKEEEEKKEGEEAKEGGEKKEGEEDLLGGFLEIKKEKLTEDDLIGNQLGGLRPGDRRFSPIELKMLGQLAERRKNLDSREEQLELRENLLTQTEQRVDEKFKEMETLRAELSEIIIQFKEVEETKIQSLVKIYENMKPKDAARIFDELEMPVLLLVIDKMKEKKAAPILAGMDPMKAKKLTVELAERRRQQDVKDRQEKIKEQQMQQP